MIKTLKTSKVDWNYDIIISLQGYWECTCAQ